MEDKKTYAKNLAPEKLELLIAIVNAPKVNYYTTLIQSSEANLQMVVQASGTSEKAIIIAVTIPLSSVIGALTYRFLSNDKQAI